MMELRRKPSAFAIATNSRIASGSRLQFTLFTSSPSQHLPAMLGGLTLPCVFAPCEPPTLARKRKHAHTECTGRAYSVPRESSAHRSRDVRPPLECHRG